MADISFEQLDESDPHNGGWTDTDDGDTKLSFWTAPAANGRVLELGITGISSGVRRFDATLLRGPGADIVFEQLDAGGAFAWMDAHDGEGGTYSIWTAPGAPGGMLEVTLIAVPGAAPRVEVTWLDTGPVAKPARAVEPVRAMPSTSLVARRAPVASTDAIDLASWRTRKRPN